MQIKIRNLRNIKTFDYEFDANKVHFIFGENGVGKSSLAKAIASSPDDIQSHETFNGWGPVEVVKPENIKVHYFDEEFIKLNVVSEGIINKSYEIIFNTPDVQYLEQKIRDVRVDLYNLTQDNDFIKVKANVNSLKKIFKLNTSRTSINQNTTVKAIKNIVEINATDVNTNMYNLFKNQSSKQNWVSWLNDAKSDFFYQDYCPYCAQTMSRNVKDSIDFVISNYKKNDLKNVKNAWDQVNDIASNVTTRINDINSIINGKSDMEKPTNFTIIKAFSSRLDRIDNLINDINKVIMETHNVKFKKININKNDIVDTSPIFHRIVDLVDDYNKNLVKINTMRNGIVKKLKKRIVENNSLIEKYLINAGIDYKLVFKLDPLSNTKIYLEHRLSQRNVINIDSTMSFGERNLLSVLLFTLCKRESGTNVFIFDDPTTLFDDNKRYAFIDLIRRRKSLKIVSKDDYVFILSHSISSLKEFLILKKSRTGSNIENYIMKNNNGDCILNKVTFSDLENYQEHIKNLYLKTNSPIVKIVLLRKLIELKYIKDPQNRIYNMISSSLKYKSPQTKLGDRVYSIAENIEAYDSLIEYCNNNELTFDNIGDYISSLDINQIIFTYINAVNDFEKIIMFRLIVFFMKMQNIIVDKNDEIMMRFVTNLYHTESDELFTLSIDKYSPIPSYIINMLDSLVSNFETLIQNHLITIDSNSILREIKNSFGI